MPTPSVYYLLHEEHERLRATIFKLLMSDEVPSLDGPFASAAFYLVGDMTETEADAALTPPNPVTGD